MCGADFAKDRLFGVGTDSNTLHCLVRSLQEQHLLNLNSTRRVKEIKTTITRTQTHERPSPQPSQHPPRDHLCECGRDLCSSYSGDGHFDVLFLRRSVFCASRCAASRPSSGIIGWSAGNHEFPGCRSSTPFRLLESMLTTVHYGEVNYTRNTSTRHGMTGLTKLDHDLG